MDDDRIEKTVKTLPCAASDCGMYESKAKEAITELLKEERIKVIDEIKRHIGHRSYDVDGMPVVIEVQKLQQYLTSIKR